MSRATLDKRPREVAAMFDEVARRYDLANTVLSLGLDRRWRRSARHVLQLRPGQRVLDLAAGTGVFTAELADTGAWAVGCDFSLGMLHAGRAHKHRREIDFVAGDAVRLPFADASFDAISISFGLRNVCDVPGTLAEMARVVRPGGKLVICEFSRPVFRPLRVLYSKYLMRLLPWVARRVASSPDAYVYLAESIREWPAQEQLGRMIADAGWGHVRYRNLSFGIVALHRADRVEPAELPQGDSDD